MTNLNILYGDQDEMVYKKYLVYIACNRNSPIWNLFFQNLIRSYICSLLAKSFIVTKRFLRIKWPKNVNIFIMLALKIAH